jgi:acyl-coenzyme A thioesterase PaaI-like protein
MRFSEIRSVIEQLRAKSPAMVEELRTVLQNPRELAVLLESRSPWLSRKLLGAASNILEPFLAGTGLAVERMDEALVEARLPGWWRNQGESGVIHTAAIAALGEFTSRISLHRVEARVLQRALGDLTGIYRMPVQEREAILLQLRRERVARVGAEVSVYDRQGRLVSQVELDWHLERNPALASGAGIEKASEGE